MKLFNYLALGALLLSFAACEDSTGTLGVDMMPSSDFIKKNYKTYGVSTESYAVGDSVLARSYISYIGRFTDPETGTNIKCDFISQFRCADSLKFSDKIQGDSVYKAEVKLYISNFIGDSLSSLKINVYELDKDIDPEADYYTNIDPTKYYDVNSKPLATKWYTIADQTITDSLRDANKKNGYTNITITLPNEVGTKIIKGYREHPENFTNTSTWVKSGLPCSKGLYFKLESGDGSIASIYTSQFNIHYRYYDDYHKKDTTGMKVFAGTEEVVQATRIENSNLEKLLADKSASYIKSPAGIFTLATLPVDEINVNDTINSAKLIFTRYNDKIQSPFKLGIPKNLLLLRLDDYLNGFFEKYLISDNETSYLTTFSSKTNTYTYSNIAKLISHMLEEKRNGTATENWNKVLIIPVEAIYDGNSQAPTLVKLNHDFSMSSSRLVGGEKDKVNMEVIYSSFK